MNRTFMETRSIDMKYNVILLDADNTLFDFNQAEVYALEKTCQTVNQPYSEEVKYIYEKNNRVLWGALEAGEIDMATLKIERFKGFINDLKLHCEPEFMSDLYLKHLGEGTFEIEGAYEMCQELSKRYQLVIVTNGITTVQENRLKSSRLKPFISGMITSEAVNCSKPNPKIFDYALELINHKSKKDVLMVGDSLTSDMQGGINAGIDTCFYNPKGNQHDLEVTHEIKHLNELVEWLK